MELNFLNGTEKEKVFEQVTAYLQNKNLQVSTMDNSRPWGGFFVIDEDEAE